MPRLVLLDVGAMNSPRNRPAGLLVTWAGHRVMLDGGVLRTLARRWMPGWSVTSMRS